MRIVQVAATVSEKYGGPAVGSVALNRALRDIGMSARLMATRAEDRRGRRMSDADVRRVREPGTDIEVFDDSRPHYLMWSWSMLAAIVREVRAADLVHIHGQYLFPHVAAYVVARLLGTPFGIQLHGSLDRYHRTRSPMLKRVHDILFGRSALRRAAYVLAASRREAAELDGLVAPSRLIVVGLGVTPATDVSRPDAVTEQVVVAPRGQRVLFLGRLTRKKRPDLLVRAWAEVARRSPSAVLVLAGPDDDLTAEELRRLATDLGVGPSVHFAGTVVGAEKAWLFRNCGIFVLPSENENFGLTVVEAMASGAYVIGSRAVASMEFVEAADSGDVLEDVSVESLATSLSRAIDAGEETRTAGARGARFAASELSWTRTAETLRQEILVRVASSSRTTAGG